MNCLFLLTFFLVICLLAQPVHSAANNGVNFPFHNNLISQDNKIGLKASPDKNNQILPDFTQVKLEDESSAMPEADTQEILDTSSSYLNSEETKFKRQARLMGVRLRTLYGSEVAYIGHFIGTQEEVGSRQGIAARIPFDEEWEGTVFDRVSFFTLKSKDEGVGRESIDLRIGKTPNRSLRPWFTLTPYMNWGSAKGEGLGITAGISKTWSDGANVTGEIYSWRPWDEGYSTILEDGQKYGAALGFTLPITKNLLLGSRGYYEELELGSGAKSGQQYAGRRYVINTRAYYRLLHRDGAYMGYGFRDDDLWNEYLVGSELGVFMQLDFQRYFKPDKFKALDPVPEVCAQEMGVAFQYAISPHIGISGEGLLGRDPDRDLQFGELAAINGRITVVVNPRLRMWAGASYIKTHTSLESTGGEETIVSFGINYAF